MAIWTGKSIRFNHPVAPAPHSSGSKDFRAGFGTFARRNPDTGARAASCFHNRFVQFNFVRAIITPIGQLFAVSRSINRANTSQILKRVPVKRAVVVHATPFQLLGQRVVALVDERGINITLRGLPIGYRVPVWMITDAANEFV
jgi:hypothetical protein